jgi:hypothetical protein
VVAPQSELVQAVEPESNREPVDVLMGSKEPVSVDGHVTDVPAAKEPVLVEAINKEDVETK